jgi:hypothetical protein
MQRAASPTPVNHGGHFGGGHFGGFHHGFHHFGGGFGFYPFPFYDSYPYEGYPYYGGDCYLVRQRLHTRHGWRLRTVRVCE